MATMGLRRRPQPVQAPASAGKRGRGAENNNSPSQGNLNSEPATKKSRRSHAAKSVKELDMKKIALWSDPRPYASIAGLSIEAQRALCSDGLASPIYMSPAIATFMGAALGKPTVGGVPPFLDISSMAGAHWPAAAAAAAAAADERKDKEEEKKLEKKKKNEQQDAVAETDEVAKADEEEEEEEDPRRSLPDDAMFTAYQPWVIKTYGDLAKTKTITVKKYARILRTLRGEEANSAENSKFRFWVKSKGFHIGQPEGYDPKPADRIVGRHTVTSSGLDPPLYVPTQPPHSKSSNGTESGASGRIYKKVAIVENFFDIIHAVHVDLEGRPGKHAGQKRTYRTITETYAFLPREAVTRFLLGCTECQRRPRTPSPTSLAATAAAAAATAAAAAVAAATTALSETPSVRSSRTPTAAESPASPRPAKALSSCVSPTPEKAEQPREPSRSSEASSVPLEQSKSEPEPKADAAMTSTTTTTTTTTTATTEATTTLTTSVTTTETTTTSLATLTTSMMMTKMTKNETGSGNSCNGKTSKEEKYNPLSITNLLRKDPVSRRSVLPSIPLARKSLESELECARQPSSESQQHEFSPATGLIGQNLNLLATIQQLHCQVMLALTQRLGSAQSAGLAEGPERPGSS